MIDSVIDSVIDIYHGTTVSSFEAVRDDGVLGIVHKASEGAGYRDPLYEERRQQVLDAGMLWGAYHFGTVDESGSAQAEFFLSVVACAPADLLVLDFEQRKLKQHGTIIDKTMTLDQAVEFVETVNSQTGRYPGLYSGPSFLKQQLGDGPNESLARCWLWLAEHGSTPHVPANWPSWTMWQYTGRGSVAGIPDDVDRDRFNGSEDELRAWWAGPAASAG